MGCRFSKKEDAPDDVVSLCGDRKRLAKAAVERRKAFAEAHCKYVHSLCAVSSAIGVFIARFSEISPPTNQSQNSVDTQQDLVQTSSDSWSDDSGLSEVEEEESGELCEHFYGDNHPLMPPQKREIGWDFFNILDNPPPPPISMSLPVKKEKLDVKKRESGKIGTKILGKVDGNGRELLFALKDLEKHFVCAYESGFVVSRMLEVSKPHLQPIMEETKEKSSRLIQTNTWNRSPSSQSSSSKSLLSPSSKSSSTGTDSSTELFDGSGGMESGSHSLTLGRLYAWEKKLYDEVKAAEITRKSYKQKCSQLKHQQGVPKDSFCPSKETAAVIHLYNRIMVATRSVESISRQIEKLRDEELQPQLVELLHGLMRTWKIMSESHETQNKIISEVKCFNSLMNGKLCNDSRRLAILQLEKELRNWQSSFLDYFTTQKAYVMCLCGWLSKLIDSGSKSSRFNGPTLLIACRNWLTSLEKLPVKEVKFTMKSLVKDLHDIWIQQGEEHEAEKKLAGLVKEMDRKSLTVKTTSILKFRGKARNSAEELIGGKNIMDLLSMRLESEKVKHQSSIERTQAATLDGLKMGFLSVFESLTDFSRASVTLYADVVTFCENSDGYH